MLSRSSRYESEVPVRGLARPFGGDNPLTGIVSVFNADSRELILKMPTDDQGEFFFHCRVGLRIFLKFEREGWWWMGYRTTHSRIFEVPEEGINHPNKLHNITFQVPSNVIFSLFSKAMGIAEDPSKAQIAVTVTPPGMTLDNIPQGEPGVEVTIEPNPGVKARYLGIFSFFNKTNPLSSHPLTSDDGGVIFPNVVPGTYKISARKGRHKVSIMIWAPPGGFVNASPTKGLVIPQEMQKPESADDPALCFN